MTPNGHKGQRRKRPATASAVSRRGLKSPPVSHSRGTGRYTGRAVGPTPSPQWFPAAIVAFIVAGVVIVMASYWGLPAGGVRFGGLAVGSVLVPIGFRGRNKIPVINSSQSGK